MMSLAAQRQRVERCQRQWRQRSEEFALRRQASVARVTGWVRMAPWALGGAWLVHRLTSTADRAAHPDSSQSDASQTEPTDQATAGNATASAGTGSQLDQLNDWLNLLGNAVQIYMLCSDAFATGHNASAATKESEQAQQASEQRSADEAMRGDLHAAQ